MLVTPDDVCGRRGDRTGRHGRIVVSLEGVKISVEDIERERTAVSFRIHASWLNQVEIYLSINLRKMLSPNDFADPDTAISRLGKFEIRYSLDDGPFKWRFTADLAHLITRIDRCHPSTTDPNPARAA